MALVDQTLKVYGCLDCDFCLAKGTDQNLEVVVVDKNLLVLGPLDFQNLW